MQSNIFIPRAQSDTVKSGHAEPLTKNQDGLSFILLRIAQWATVLLGALIAVFFTVGTPATLHFDKIVFAVSSVVVVVVVLSLLLLRRRNAETIIPASLVVLAMVGVVGVISALFSGDVGDALWGSVLEVHTAGFMLLILAVAALPLTLQKSKPMTVRFLWFFTLVSLVIIAGSLIRVLFDETLLSFGTFFSATSTMVGSFNDLAIFAGVVVIGTLIGAIVLPLRGVAAGGLTILSLMSIVLLAIINFSLVWYVLGLFALLTFIYLITAPETHAQGTVSARHRLPIVLAAVLCLVSVLFIIAGQPLSDRINSFTGTTYVEVRPSPAATLEIVRQVYNDSPWLGVGPNRFADAWRLYKDTSLNQTIFWDTDFVGGYGYVPTWFVTTGAVGGLLLVLFHLSFLVGGVRTLVTRSVEDSFWYFTAVFSFLSAMFIIIMSYLYVPSATLLLLGAFFIGLTYATYGTLLPASVKSVPLVRTRQLGLVFTAFSIVLILCSLFLFRNTIQAYGAAWQFGRDGAPLTTLNLSKAIQTVLLQNEIRTLETLLFTATPNEEVQQQFVTVATNAIALIDELRVKDATDPQYPFARAKVYAYLTLTGVDGALTNAEQSFKAAEILDPHNPKYALAQAQLYFEIGDLTRAREAVTVAVELKPNYTDALFVLTQIDVAEGNTETAITTARSLISLEPNNPSRYYQLGTLHNAINDPAQAIVAFDQALARNPQFANARYFKALALIALDQEEEALVELNRVRETNPDNEELLSVIAAVEAGEGVNVPLRPLRRSAPATIPSLPTDFDEATSDLISPVNQSQSVVIPEESPVATTGEVVTVPTDDATVE